MRPAALYCSCGVVRAPDNDQEPDRKSEGNDVTPLSGDVGDSGAGTGLVMQNTIRLEKLAVG